MVYIGNSANMTLKLGTEVILKHTALGDLSGIPSFRGSGLLYKPPNQGSP